MKGGRSQIENEQEQKHGSKYDAIEGGGLTEGPRLKAAENERAIESKIERKLERKLQDKAESKGDPTAHSTRTNGHASGCTSGSGTQNQTTHQAILSTIYNHLRRTD